ncbi:NADP-dependent phosphogluconate dehydrogenase [Panacibacter sp. DH6]|uniref:6-phosphogluconate dehydrogenase, decarboxylating n=1 Tax=Panacibacter microcysteis TaxID=2793269 RepID=A0A931E4Y4_9BACT|nr:NADP-dependent phosphogluconate dehydrogenase [Panacibacter microcysteis]MBG9375229.1 NADP-dependent phosphogluconate dehydrogenase [Panacibacter microcysteis]
MESQQYDFGMIGLGVMGRNLLLNMADHGFAVIGFDLDAQKGVSLESSATKGTSVKGVTALIDLVNNLKAPKKIMMLVPAGKPVDDVIESLLPLISKGDIIIDGGNSHYTDTLRRVNYLHPKGIHFMGMGVSGGEQGARNGPSIMPGGDAEAYQHVKPLLEAIAAKVNNEPCTAYMGKDAAGHYVKMVHNGIEYAIMQLISEVYDILKRGAGLSNSELHEVFKQWNDGELQSFLVEITRDIFLQKDDLTGNDLLDVILDKAGSKGTGKWTSQDAMDLPVAIPTIDMSVSLRTVSAYKDERVLAASLYKPVVKIMKGNKEAIIKQLHDALYFATIICYAQGLAMLHKASYELKMDIPLKDVVKAWRGGCIIRSSLLEVFYNAYNKKGNKLPNILLDKSIAGIIKKKDRNMRAAVKIASQNKLSCACLMSALSYFDAYTTERMPTNLIQAQRDYFGAHTYQRTDKEGTFHTVWGSNE